jgi:hypothetical protein
MNRNPYWIQDILDYIIIALYVLSLFMISVILIQFYSELTKPIPHIETPSYCFNGRSAEMCKDVPYMGRA